MLPKRSVVPPLSLRRCWCGGSCSCSPASCGGGSNAALVDIPLAVEAVLDANLSLLRRERVLAEIADDDMTLRC